MSGVILFDGVCNFCNGSVQFILKRDAGYFRFASLQSEAGQRLLNDHQMEPRLDSFFLIENGRLFIKSTAALRVCRHLKGAWKLFYILLIIPKSLRDFVYDMIAKNRYKWFGKQESCRIPSPGEKERFLE
ncbi:thiol-disulfide oxidoreductase DCC family protein [Falsibacillus albus]|uniref:Thiol-disulfide oxidoreductase DCC family protein n=1 Tax=Falsibacillus albus TaxID=2478915 RepID=A0A3L7K0E1_9BACI|nr:thiol-disulfide oxidoreductase DCC family protein [Falsibacillus albus]RLQ96230.1 thiol-disulfide oxidoreductase DCC family protein [Falsibacillus albus]